MSVMRAGALVLSLSHGQDFGKLSEVQPASVSKASPRKIPRAARRHNAVLLLAISLDKRRGIV
jgi:hypothetical protein